MPSDVIAHGFPRDLDGHPPLAWMGEDWVSFVALQLLAQLRTQDPGTELLELWCTGPVDVETRAADSAVSSMVVRIPLELRLRDGSGAEHVLSGIGTFGGPEPRTVGFEIETPEERMIAVLEEAKALVLRPGNDFLWSSWEDAGDAAREIDEYVARLRLGPIGKRAMAGMFAPTGPLQELALSSGWSAEYSGLAARFDAIAMVARETWMCAVCGADAGSIELRDRGGLRRESFTGVLTQDGAPSALWNALETGRADAVFAVDPELAPWWCPQCSAGYCGEHWTRWDVFDEDEPAFHDSIRGRCPRGHERMLED